MRVLGGDDQVHRRTHLPQRRDGEQPQGAAADQCDPAGVHLGGRVHGTGGGFHDHGRLVGQLGRHRDQLALVGDHERRPAAAGALAEPALEARLDVAEADALAVVDAALGARRAHRVDASGDAAQDGHHDGALPIVEIAHHLVAGGERERHDRLEPARRPALDRGQVRAADARQARPHPHPAGPGETGRVDVTQGEGSDLGAAAGSEPARHDGGRELGRLAREHQRLHRCCALRAGALRAPGFADPGVIVAAAPPGGCAAPRGCRPCRRDGGGVDPTRVRSAGAAGRRPSPCRSARRATRACGRVPPGASRG